MMQIILGIGAALLPGIVLLVYIYIKDKYQREPLLQILKGVLFGALSCVVAIAFATLFEFLGLYGIEYTSIGGAFATAFFGAAVPEESAKLIMLYLFLRRNRYYDEFFDGIVYAVTVGLGFAMVENILYVVQAEDWQSVALTRAIFSVPGHYMFAVIMGYFYSLVSFRNRGMWFMPLVLMVPIVFHGLFDAILMSEAIIASDFVRGMAVLIFIAFFIWAQRRAKNAIRRHLENDRLTMNDGLEF
ncbi:MAG: PrsW family glutamic-type intramembrane protease [Paludibacteraceae bacterium]|nr:PrsW family glutamic-type intramembrane protease [Paludibacteraceae bacterium]